MRRPALGVLAGVSLFLSILGPAVLTAGPAAAAPSESCVNVAINDVSKAEGNLLTTDFDFTVTVTFPTGCNNTAGEAVDYATQDGTRRRPSVPARTTSRPAARCRGCRATRRHNTST